ncbi:hypothetical protein [Nucisporomicrobium flavum]|uniref:hypothetical protein n=1 Tax=Nucisporomicrobium flavum TaxID=2785915 RepID=UPI0018F65961|nr:hypothetical protein [Nucisporomicrobium flavum]
MLLAVVAMAAAVAMVAAAQPAAAATRTVVPAAAMLQPADLGVPVTTAAADLRPWLRPPQPCGPFRSSARRTADNAVQALYPVSEIRPTVLLEYVAVYRGGGAAQYLRELRRAVTRCHGCTDPAGRTWRLLDTRVAGRDSLLIGVAETFDYGDSVRVKTTYVAVARVGHAVVVLADIGWEAGDGHENLVREFVPIAVDRASILR